MSSVASDAEEHFSTALNTPLPHDNPMEQRLEPPNQRFSTFSPSTASPRDSYNPSTTTPDNSAPLLVDQPAMDAGADRSPHVYANTPAYDEKRPAGAPRSRRRRPLLWLAALAALAAVFLAVFLPVFFTVIRPRQHKSSAAAAAHGPNPESPTGATTGGNGSLVTALDGTTFTYVNPYGGYCECLELRPRRPC